MDHSFINIVKKEFENAIANNDVETFFKKYKRLEPMDLSYISGIKTNDIRNLMYSKTRGKPSKSIKHKKKPVRIFEKFEDTKEWWLKYGTELPVYQLAMLSGYDNMAVLKRVLKHCGILRQKKSHPFCNEKWLTDNYLNKKLSVEKCAKLAGVNSLTIREWMKKLGIPKRESINVVVKSITRSTRRS